jgi:hypothetical protein
MENYGSVSLIDRHIKPRRLVFSENQEGHTPFRLRTIKKLNDLLLTEKIRPEKDLNQIVNVLGEITNHVSTQI